MTPPIALVTDPFLGTVIDGKYRIEHKLGEGGIGLVYQATHLSLDHPVAVKVLRLDQGHTDESAERLAREARTMARLDSPHIVEAVDFGYLPSGHPFLVLEYLTGETLAALLDRTGPLSLERTCRYMLEAMLGLAEAHRKGVVHRDLKPDNLYLTTAPGGDERIKLLDFGISKQQRPGLSKLTRPHVSLGSPQYMAPEQVLAEEVDARADIWALGVVLYELTTGVLPFDGVSLADVCARVVQASPLPPSRHNPNLSKAFDELVLKCLQKSPSARPEDVMDVARALEQAAGVRPEPGPAERSARPSLPRPHPLRWWVACSFVAAIAVAHTAATAPAAAPPAAQPPSAPRAPTLQAPEEPPRAPETRVAERAAPSLPVAARTLPAVTAPSRPVTAPTPPDRVRPAQSPRSARCRATARDVPRAAALSEVEPTPAPHATPALQAPSPLPAFGGRS